MASFEEIVHRLEAEWEQAEADELAIEVADRTRGELARLTLIQRLRPAVGYSLTINVHGGLLVRGLLRGVGPDWLLVCEDGQPGSQTIVALASVLWIDGLGRTSSVAGSEGVVAARSGLGMMLRRLVRDRADVALVLIDAGVVTGVLDRAGVDHVELAVVPVGEARRRSAVTGVRAIPIAAIALIRRAS